MRESLRQYCQRMSLDWLADEFALDRNAPLTPDTVRYGSAKPVWWRCEKGHEFRVSPSSRRNGSRCPYCAGIRPVVGVNDLATTNPELAAEWHPTKNGALRPEDLIPSSKKLVWWCCPRGHEYTAFPKTRVGGSGCPICEKGTLHTKKMLADAFPALAAEWNRRRNGSLSPEEVAIDSNKKVWWQCDKGHEWQAPVLARTTTNSPCPICNGRKLVKGVNDLLTVNPKLAVQFAAENAPLAASDVSVNSSKRVWWRCEKGHLWRASVASRSEENKRCPYCSGKIAPKEIAQLNTL